jgi:hypothetical protein
VPSTIGKSYAFMDSEESTPSSKNRFAALHDDDDDEVNDEEALAPAQAQSQTQAVVPPPAEEEDDEEAPIPVPPKAKTLGVKKIVKAATTAVKK